MDLNNFTLNKAAINKFREIDKGLGRYAEAISKFIWPWREQWLIITAAALAVLDFTSTYFLLELNGKSGFQERGLLAVWALNRGGFGFLLLVDITAVLTIAGAATIARYIYCKYGFNDYGRAAFVFLLLPYIILTAYAFINNTVLLLR